MSALFSATTIDGTSTCRASRMCSRVCGADHEDRTVHLGGARDHVLDVVRVPRAVDVRVVTVLRLVLDVRRVDRDAALALLGSVVDRVERPLLGVARALLCKHLRDRGGQGRLAVVDVTDCADVQMRLVALEFLLAHSVLSFLTWSASRRSR